MQGRAIIQEIVWIIHELNCIHKYYSTYMKDLFWKLDILLHNSNIYICAGERDDNMIFLHEIDWKIKMNNRHMSLMLLATLKIVSCIKNYCYQNNENIHIVKLLCLPTSLYKHVLTEFEYQLQLEFDICIEPTINYKYPYEFWYQTWNIGTDLALIPLFHEFAIWDWNDILVLLCTVCLCHLISQINMSVHDVFLTYYKSWKQYINSKVMKLLLL